MSTDALKDVFKQAAEIAKSVPKEFREAAFNRAVDALLMEKSKGPRSQTLRGRSGKGKAKRSSDPGAAVSDNLLANLDRTKHPEITSSGRVLERSLFLLRAARDDLNVDELGATQIAKVISDKFRIRTNRQAVTQALDSAGDKVDRMKSQRGVVYRLMHPGDEYLNVGDFPSGRGPRRQKETTKKAAKKKSSGKEAAKKKAPAKTTTRKRAPKSGRPGPGSMIGDLVSSGFFSKKRSISDIRRHCETKLAHNYFLNELSTPLRRAVHNGLLNREQNAEGQYEYIAK